MKKYLRRSKKNKVFAGIFGGIGEYVDIDPVVFRFGYVVMTLFTGIFPGMIAYVLGLFIVPEADGAEDV
ncbi:MAG: PspC domain-containing protein [Patescibacteria group bacterium UBA2103]